MPYELAKKLKDAGFPQGPYGNRTLEPQLVDPRRTVAEAMEQEAYAPTLEELIDACGDNFAWLHHSVKSKRWAVQDFIYDEDEGPHGGQGSTPTEAVARLWLALNSTKSSPERHTR